MIESDVFVQALQDIGVEFFSGVPDALLGGILETLLERRLYIPATRPDEALAMAAGAYMAGKVSAVLMSSAGLGAALTTLTSLNVLYRQPCLLIMAWRGFQGQDAPEHQVIGQQLPHLLDAVKVPHRTVSEAGCAADLKWAAQTFMAQRTPVALLLPKGVVKGLQP